MRTTLDLDDDVLQAVKEIAKVRSQTSGRVASDLIRKAIEPKRKWKMRNGVPIFERRPGEPLLTTEMVNRMLDDE